MEKHSPILILYTQILSSVALISIIISLLFMLAKKTNLIFAKATPFECGFIPSGSSRAPLSIQFFLISLVFLIFDMELILMFPILTGDLNLIMLNSLGLLMFLFIMALGLVWEWSQGSLNWLK